MARIVTQDKLNELLGLSIDLGKGGGYCPTYKEIIINWGNKENIVNGHYLANRLVKEEDVITKQCFMLGMVQTEPGTSKIMEFYTDNTTKLVNLPSDTNWSFVPGCADPITGVALMPLTNGMLCRNADGTYKAIKHGLTGAYAYNIPGVAFYIVASNYGQVYVMPYNSDKTSVEVPTKCPSTHMGAGPFDVSDNYFLTVTKSQVRVYEKPTPTSTFEQSTYNSLKSNATIASGEPEFMNVIMVPSKASLMLVNVEGGMFDDYDAVVIPISAGLPQTGKTITFNIPRQQGMYTFIRNVKLSTVVPSYARYGSEWPASYMFYYNSTFKTSEYGAPDPMLDVVYSLATNTYYGVRTNSSFQSISARTILGLELMETNNVVTAASAWNTSSIKFPNGFFDDHYLGYLTVLK